jgi:WD40 repeat protein
VTVATDTPSPVVDLEEAAGGRLLVAATFDAGTLLLDPRTLRVVAGPLGADNAVLGVSVDESGHELAVAASSRVDRWQVYPGRAPVALEPVGGGATATYTARDELTTGALDGSVTAWQLRPEVPGLAPLDVLGAGNPRFDPTGRVLAMWGFGSGVRLFDAQSLEPIAELPFEDPEHTSFSGLAFNSDGSRVAALWCTGPASVFDAPCDGRVGVYEVASGRAVAGPSATGQLAPWVAGAIAWSADDAWLATGHVDGTVEVRRAGDLRVETTLTDLAVDGGGFVTEVDFSGEDAPSHHLVATVGTDAATWSVPDWETVGRARVGVTAHFTPDGRVLTSDQDGTVRLRDSTLSVLETYRGLALPVIRPRFSLDGSRFVTVDDFTGEARIWRTDPLAPVGGPIAVAGPAGGVTLSPDGTRMVVGGERAWELRLDPEKWEQHACAAAGRNLTRDEWTAHLGDEPYRRTCSEFPPGG